MDGRRGVVTGPVLPAIFDALVALFSWLVQTAALTLWRKLRGQRALVWRHAARACHGAA